MKTLICFAFSVSCESKQFLSSKRKSNLDITLNGSVTVFFKNLMYLCFQEFIEFSIFILVVNFSQ